MNRETTIFFDGVCNLCSSSVQWIIKHDSRGYFYFSSLESPLGESLIEEYELTNIDTIILLQDEKVYLYSDAVLRIVKELDSWYRYLYIFRFLPKVFRDAIYKIVAKYRYRVFGRTESCMVPTKEMSKRFL